MTIMVKRQNSTSSNDSETEATSREENNESDEADDEISEISDDETENQTEKSNLAWVDSISKILKLNKPKGKKTIVLSKAKKLTDVKRLKPKPAGFEVQTDSGQIKEEQIEPNGETDLEPPHKKKHNLPNLRVKPNILDKDRERTLQKIATKGVVQLFNAVKMQQNEISEKLKEAGPLEIHKEKILKSIDKKAFLDVLMSEKSQNVDTALTEHKKENMKHKDKDTAQDTTWNVLREDFMMGAKMKDWDKEVENESENEMEQNIESD